MVLIFTSASFGANVTATSPVPAALPGRYCALIAKCGDVPASIEEGVSRPAYPAPAKAKASANEIM